ncbi:Ppx/GppA family phosphatase [Elioraea tepida]|uniref:Ppx/GppA family phosphatase n=1 Tax=Elioraea tepida TaxID=2843330 RepID=A0A975U4A4_9PROT|nr:Ppx/GppA phosphatase family protein [Elioraea tepida]QXM24786.1 Ppx/GppA family phosphatase [Elioraea tepida]
MPPHALHAERESLPLYAALDLGTNNCRLLVAAPTAHGFRVLDSFSRIVRLGEGLATTGALSPEAMDRAVAALAVCADKLGRRKVRRIRAVATEACRRAANGARFLARVRETTGLAFEVIGPREEAELAVESCAPLLAGPERRALLFDIGGGSTELAWLRIDGEGEITLTGYASVPLGVVTLAERWREAAFTAEGFEAMTIEAMAALLPFDAVHCISAEVARGQVRLVGTSGTVTTLAGVSLGLARYSRAMVDGRVLAVEAADRALATVREMGREGLTRHPCIGPQRVDFVLPGCAVFAAIRRLWPVPAIVVADRGLREGILLRLMRADRGRIARQPSRPVTITRWSLEQGSV